LFCLIFFCWFFGLPFFSRAYLAKKMDDFSLLFLFDEVFSFPLEGFLDMIPCFIGCFFVVSPLFPPRFLIECLFRVLIGRRAAFFFITLVCRHFGFGRSGIVFSWSRGLFVWSTFGDLVGQNRPCFSGSTRDSLVVCDYVISCRFLLISEP